MKRREFLKATGMGSVLLTGGIIVGQQKTVQTTETQKSGETLLEPARHVPIVDHADIIVCGGGPAGIGAAISAARTGARTILLESAGCLGGVWTAGAICCILDSGFKEGIMKEIHHALNKDKKYDSIYDPESMKYLLENKCLDAGVSFQMYTMVSGVVQDADNRIIAVVTESKSGRQAFCGKMFIDCTGDGDLGALSGCGFDWGNPKDGHCQPMSLMAILTGLDASALDNFYQKDAKTDHRIVLRNELKRIGIIPSYGLPTLYQIQDNIYAFMGNHEFDVQGISASDLTRATVQARRELHQMVDGLRNSGGIWSQLRIVTTAERIGVREGRRLHGLYTITEEDLLVGRKHEDAVCRVRYPVDVHAPHQTENGLSDFRKAEPYDIPLRALIARDIPNLFMAGRCISGDFTAHSSYRVTGNAVPMGEAVGREAAKRTGYKI